MDSSVSQDGSIAKASLYVSGLDASVTEDDLRGLFGKYGQLLSVKICRNLTTGVSLGYGFVDFTTLQDAATARKLLNSAPLNGNRIRVMLSNSDPNLNSGRATIFFKHLDASLDKTRMDKLFSTYGTIVTSELAVARNGDGYGYVMFNQEDAAQSAIDSLYRMVVNDTPITIGPFISKEDRDRERPNFHNYPILYVNNMTTVVYNDEVESAFRVFGNLVHTHVARDGDGYPTGSGFVVFQNFDQAVSAIKGLNGKHPADIKGLHDNSAESDPVWYVGWANSMYKPKDRRQSGCGKQKCVIHKKLEGAGLYIKNFDDGMTEKKLKKLFSDFGMVIYSKVMLDSQGQSRGCGFVGFVTPEDATKAMNAMNGKIVGRKPLHVSVALRDKGRKADLQVLDEEYDSGTKFTQLANVVSGGTKNEFPSGKVGEDVDFRHYPSFEVDDFPSYKDVDFSSFEVGGAADYPSYQVGGYPSYKVDGADGYPSYPVGGYPSYKVGEAAGYPSFKVGGAADYPSYQVGGYPSFKVGGAADYPSYQVGGYPSYKVGGPADYYPSYKVGGAADYPSYPSYLIYKDDFSSPQDKWYDESFRDIRKMLLREMTLRREQMEAGILRNAYVDLRV